MSVGYDCPGGRSPEQDQWRVTNDNQCGSYIHAHLTRKMTIEFVISHCP